MLERYVTLLTVAMLCSALNAADQAGNSSVQTSTGSGTHPGQKPEMLFADEPGLFPVAPRLLRNYDVEPNYGVEVLYEPLLSDEYLQPWRRDTQVIPASASVELGLPEPNDGTNADQPCRQEHNSGGESGEAASSAGEPIDCELSTDCRAKTFGGPEAAVVPRTAAHPVPSRSAASPLREMAAEEPEATADDECPAEPPLKSKVNHLLEAARHLEGAGYEEEAKIFRAEADAIRTASTRLLEEKRRELERVQREISELEELTGQSQAVLLQCEFIELQLPADCDAAESLPGLEERGMRVLTGRPVSGDSSSTSRLLSGEELANALRAIQKHPCATLKTIARPSIMTMNGRAATIRSGEEFPIIVPVEATSESPESQSLIEWRNFGITLQAVPFILGDDKVRLSLEAEVAERDFTHMTPLPVGVVPSVTTRRIRTDVEAEFRETVAIACTTAPTASEGDRTVLLVLVTPTCVSN